MTPESQPHQPLSDEQLDRLLRQHKPVPPPDWQDRFWQDLDARLAQDPASGSDESVDFKPIRSPRLWLRPSLMAAAAAFIVLLISVPMTRKLNQDFQQTDLALGRVSENHAKSTVDNPMVLGAAPGLEKKNPIHAASVSSQPLPRDRGERRQQEAGGALGQNAENQDEAGLQPGHLVPPGATKDKQAARSQADDQSSQALGTAAEDPVVKQLQELLEPLEAEIILLQPGRYEVRLPASESEAFEQKLKDWPVRHNLLEQALHEKQEVVYHIDTD